MQDALGTSTPARSARTKTTTRTSPSGSPSSCSYIASVFSLPGHPIDSPQTNKKAFPLKTKEKASLSTKKQNASLKKEKEKEKASLSRERRESFSFVVVVVAVFRRESSFF